MLRVKICGICSLEDALCAIDAGADALGFVFYEKSPRFISPQDAAKICKVLPPFVQRVGLFVNADAKEVNATCKEASLHMAQIHFEASEEFYKALEVPFVPVIRATCKEDLEKFHGQYRLVDAFVPGYGGEGKRIELSWFRGLDCSKMIIAGGLDEHNIKEVKPLGFYGVDVSSGVEASKGIKDAKKVAAFIKKAKQ